MLQALTAFRLTSTAFLASLLDELQLLRPLERLQQHPDRVNTCICIRISTAVISASSPLLCIVADESNSGSVETPEPLGKTLYLGALFGGWYAFNILFNMWVPVLSTWRGHRCRHADLCPCVVCTMPSRAHCD